MPRNRNEDAPQYQPGASQYRPQTVESDDEIEREFEREFDDRIDPDMSDAEPQNDDDASRRRDVDRVISDDDLLSE